MKLAGKAVRAILAITMIGLVLPVILGTQCSSLPVIEEPGDGSGADPDDGGPDGADNGSQADPGDGEPSGPPLTVAAETSITLGSLQWSADFTGLGYQILAEFAGSLDPQTAQTAAYYRISDTTTHPASATLNADGRTVELIFINVALSADTAFDLSVGGGVTDASGSSVPETSGLVPEPNATDVTPPTAVARRWGANWEDGYRVEVEFSEAMDRTSVEAPRAYLLKEGDVEIVASTAALHQDGKTAILIFDDLAISTNARLSFGILPIKDINGNAVAYVTNQLIAPNPSDAIRPRMDSFVDHDGEVKESVRFSEDFTAGGYEVIVEYSEVMDKATAETTTAYSINGTRADSATLGGDGRTMTLVFEGVASADSELDIEGNRVGDINRRFLAAQSDLEILPAGAVGATPGAATLTWLKDSTDGYHVWAVFNEAMDEATVENESNWRIRGTTIKPTQVVLSHTTSAVTGEIAGRTAKLTFGNTAMSRTDRIDVSVGDSIRDVNGDALTEVPLAINANPRDTLAPGIDSTTSPPTWAPGGTNQPYQVTLRFSEAMDRTSATTRENYRLAGGHPTAAAIANDGRTATLTFAQTTAGIGASDQLQVSASVRDINGRFNTSVAPLDVAAGNDGVGPDIDVVFWGVNKGPYEVNVAFSEVMDRDSAANPLAYMLEDRNRTARNPTGVTLSPNGTTAILQFDNYSFGIDGTLDPPLPQFSVDQSPANAPRDINGRVYAGGGAALPAAPEQLDTVDEDAPELASITWAVDSMDYRVIATFSEALDAFAAENPVLYSLGDYPLLFLFSVVEDVAQLVIELDNEILSRELRLEFARNEIPLSQAATVSILKTGDRWLISDDLLAYLVVRAEDGEDTLNVCRLVDPLSPSAQAQSATPLDRGVQVELSFSGVFDKDPIFSVIEARDMHGNAALLSGEVKVNPNDRNADLMTDPDTGRPSAVAAWIEDYGPEYGYGFGYQLRVLFSNEVLDRQSAEDPANYVIYGYADTATNATLLAVGDGIVTFAGRTVILTFTTLPLNRFDRVDVSVGNSVSDVNGNYMPQVTGVPIDSNPADTTRPIVLSAAGYGRGQVRVTFSEAMDQTTAETLSYYRLVGADPRDPTGATDLLPFDATLAVDGRTVILRFFVPISYVVPVWGETLITSVDPDGPGPEVGTIRDINGQLAIEDQRLVQ